MSGVTIHNESVEDAIMDITKNTNYSAMRSKADHRSYDKEKLINNTENMNSVENKYVDKSDMMSILSSVDVYWAAIQPLPHPETLSHASVEVVIGNDLNIFHVGQILDVSLTSGGAPDEYAWTIVKFDKKQMEVPMLRIRHSDLPYPILQLPSNGSSLSPSSDRRTRTSKGTENSDTSLDHIASPNRNMQKHCKGSLESAMPYPLWTPPWQGNERKATIIDHYCGDRVEVFRPATKESPASWTRAIIRYVFKEDLRKASKLGLLDIIPDYIHDERRNVDCPNYWGGICDCIFGNKCKGMDGTVPHRCVAYEIEWSTLPNPSASPYSLVPWYACRPTNQNSPIKPTDVCSSVFEIPEFLCKRQNKSGDEFELFQSEAWIESESTKSLLNQLRFHSQVLVLSLKCQDSKWVISLIGTASQIGIASQYLELQVNHVKNAIEFIERREKRLRLLEERKSRYERNQQLEFEADDGLVGLIIGKQGEHLSRIARNHKVEIRVLPDDDGFRRVRIYGDNHKAAIKAKNELSFSISYIPVDRSKATVLSDKRGFILRELALKANLNSIWIDQGFPQEEKLGVRDSTAVLAVESAAKHPIKSKSIIKGTPSNPVVIICGLVSSLERAKNIILYNNTFDEMISAIGPVNPKKQFHMNDRTLKRQNVRRY